MTLTPRKTLVYLVGAGPGNPELITLRGVACLKKADLILYDALVHHEVLTHARSDAEKVFVGKRAGRISERQADINARIINAARTGKTVVRLKGGDPFLFGRGSEEAEALVAAGITYEVVPGVSSPMAACAYAGISLTHRDLSSSVAYITASESPTKTQSSHDWAKLATATQTLVVFMGARRLDQLAQTLIANGRDAATPAAVIQWASLPTQRIVSAPLASIAKMVNAAGLGLPSLVVIGSVCDLHTTLSWYDVKPLFGKTVLVTRPEHQALEVSRKLRERGAAALCIPTIRIAPTANQAALSDAVKQCGSYDWIIFTSQNGVHAFFDELARQTLDARHLGSAKVCAIGPATQEALATHHVRADIVPARYQAEDVVDALAKTDLSGKRVLLPRAAVARDVIPRELTRMGATVDVVDAYQTLAAAPEDQQRLSQAIHDKKIDVILLTSSSTAEHLVQALKGQLTSLQGVTIASIGPITTATAQSLGLKVDLTASEYTIDGLLDALEGHMASAP